ncbi:phosphotransferase family protein [Paractinoplanes durhamensis]|uniref:Aminoglycoside phosphotransferase domain-containing protein n=1 Tax=Paractinoplanes durhamensis TaxID=113563 RepID=A0ABQ3Z396_9ACTN|nr:aminoglycoside phosphotransferase family protein [Actinoplanes durhamensis]GIE04266.1 hypothetical protein Adu01nite_56160 [Actinoplanes durhamensis]
MMEWVETALPGRHVVSSRVLTGGYSNHNVLLEMNDGTRFVLRRYLGKNRCAVEAALSRRLQGVVPVPAVVATDEPAGLLLSEFVPGTPEIPGYSAGETLARLGAVTFEAPGFFSDETLTPDGTEPIGWLDAFVDRCLREGNAAGHLTPLDQKSLLRYAAALSPELDVLQGSHQLVHGDYNPKNLLATTEVTAVLDWEFAFSSSPLFDIGNMLRDPRPPGFTDAFLRGYQDAGGTLPDNWQQLSRALDLYSLADFLTRPPDHRYFGKAVDRIRELLR